MSSGKASQQTIGLTLMVLLLAGCSGAPTSLTPTDTFIPVPPTDTSTPILMPPTATPQPTDTLTPEPTLMDKPKPTVPLTSTPTPEPTATLISTRVRPGSTEVIYYSGEFELKGFLCLPDGVGPFPAVVYNHGGLGNQIGGAPAETCEALAQDGFVGFSPIRRQTKPLTGHLDDVWAGVDYVKRLDYVDENRIGIMGFSRGGFLTFMAATARPNDFEAIVIMASAVEILDGYLPRVSNISAPVLLLISENDNARQDHVQAMQKLNEALESAGKEVKLIIYPPYQNDGHRMFFEVGDYWGDVQVFLHENLKEN